MTETPCRPEMSPSQSLPVYKTSDEVVEENLKILNILENKRRNLANLVKAKKFNWQERQRRHSVGDQADLGELFFLTSFKPFFVLIIKFRLAQKFQIL